MTTKKKKILIILLSFLIPSIGFLIFNTYFPISEPQSETIRFVYQISMIITMFIGPLQVTVVWFEKLGRRAFEWDIKRRGTREILRVILFVISFGISIYTRRQFPLRSDYFWVYLDIYTILITLLGLIVTILLTIMSTDTAVREWKIMICGRYLIAYYSIFASIVFAGYLWMMLLIYIMLQS